MVIVVTNDSGGDRHLSLIPAEDEWKAERLGAELRAEGLTAVTRPDDGPRLDAWIEHAGGRAD